MHQGNWKCSTCGGAITELPFEPRSETGLTCRTCYGKQKDRDAELAPETVTASEAPNDMPDDASIASEPAPIEDSWMGAVPTTGATVEKPKFGGDWSCAGCGEAITSLPFQPRDTSNLKCIDCFKKSKG
jgi:CxxC-x17-CxxC domain-containing protein